MAEKKSKFAALADLHRAEPDIVEDVVASPAPPEEPEPARITPVASAPQVAPGRRVVPTTPVVDDYPRRGRPPTGKRSDPQWKLYSHYLKRQTQRAAVAKLQAADDGRDLSDVLEDLLQQWLKR